jgi:hypothetical protein
MFGAVSSADPLDEESAEAYHHLQIQHVSSAAYGHVPVHCQRNLQTPDNQNHTNLFYKHMQMPEPRIFQYEQHGPPKPRAERVSCAKSGSGGRLSGTAAAQTREDATV